MNPLQLLRHHVTGAIKRGEKQAIVEQVAPLETLHDHVDQSALLSVQPIATPLRDPRVIHVTIDGRTFTVFAETFARFFFTTYNNFVTNKYHE